MEKLISVAYKSTRVISWDKIKIIPDQITSLNIHTIKYFLLITGYKTTFIYSTIPKCKL